MDEHPIRIRPMTLADCDRVAELRVRGWQHAYRGLMPGPYLDALSVPADAARRRDRFLTGDGSVTNLVAEHAGEVVGWAAHGPYREGERHTADAELYAIYVAPARLGTGIGRTLLAATLDHCSDHPRLLLWVLRENTRARRFYERAGFRADGTEETFEAGGAQVPEVRYVRESRA
ncbi:GNAT family N-acetyltransferase [Streptomyces sp. LP11]|uniref:GNAT family N-acetyltransferase n=1 Tax=Streptomyces pyxinicus TaxID=2970331 RepID=A0ABT2AUS7_9ACTN|nr:GNAT family N-acetyltransferase [Streptomyces sp. LP11]MCS0600004.1 GNAT family N-acetyltransferase [Streptomyces sp. LP11]